MATYIQLMTLTENGREKTLRDPTSVRRAQDLIAVSGVQELGLYGVLGDYDFVNIVEADDNETVAQFSLELGVRAGVHIMTLPAIPIGRLEPRDRDPSSEEESTVSLPEPFRTQEEP